MHRCYTVALLVMIFATSAVAGSKIEGTTTLKDFQPAGTTDKKTHKHQQYDLSFVAEGKQYTCRTNESESLKATDFVVGSGMDFEINGTKGKVKSVSGKKAECSVVRVAAQPAPAQPAPPTH
jgi:uncharacterized protein YfaP (DUF2135 family)